MIYYTKKFIAGIIFLLTVSSVFQTSSQGMPDKQSSDDNRIIILTNDYTNEERNILLSDDVEYLKTQLPLRHKYPFDNISKKEFEEQMDDIKTKVNKLNNFQVFTEINKVISSIGDAHTSMNYFDGYTYPLNFYSFDDGIYVINADKSLGDILYTKLISINGVPVDSITDKLKNLISHENDSWAEALLPTYLELPVYMYGLGIIPDERVTTFSFKDRSGKIIKKDITTLPYGKYPDYCIKYNEKRNPYIYDQSSEKYYWYEILHNNVLYFKYNVCSNMKDEPFAKFNDEMFDTVKDYDLDKIVVDLRNNSGGDSRIINPFLDSLSEYIASNDETKVYIVIGRDTFSSGVMAALDVKNTVPAILIGEDTGGSPNSYGEVRTLNLPNSQIPVTYSVKYFKMTNDNAQTIKPDVEIKPSVTDFEDSNDVVMEYILNNNK